MNSRPLLLSLVPITCFFLGWQVLANFELINVGLFPAPTKIVNDIISLWDQEIAGQSVLLTHLVITLRRLFLAAIAGVAVGIAVGVVMGRIQWMYRFLDPIVTLVMPIPGIAMAPVFIAWMGFGDPTIISVGAIATFFPVAYNTSTGVRSIDKNLVRSAKIMGVKGLQIAARVYLPWAAVYVFTGVKLGLARCWRTVVAVEFIAAANWGLGYMIWDAAEYLRAGTVYGGIIVLALTFTLLEKGLLDSFEKLTIEKWGMLRG
jgi:ABC-type nitrate/sulfonate/bicarbonate transport system permease component